MAETSKAVKAPLNRSQKNIFWLLFLGVVIINLYGTFIENEFLIHFSKPFIVPFIAIYFSTTWKESSENSIIYKSMMIGFFFAWLGDLYMMFSYDMHVMLLGLGSFLICHQLYIVALFFAAVKDNYKWAFFLTFPLSIVGGLIGDYIGFENESMKAPVMVYSIIISVMFSFTLIRFITIKNIWGFMTCIGGALFIASDLMIGLKNFQNVDIPEVYIMMTYIGAQVLITRGMLAEGEYK